MLRVVCWLWKPVRGYRSLFNNHHVNIFRNMIERHYHGDHEVVCITDSPDGIDPRVRVVPIWDDHADLASPHGGVSPSCYRRLRAFSPEMADIIGPRFVSMDLDVVITGDLGPVFDRTEDFIIWGSTIRTTPYNGSMWMMNAGARAKVWETFDSRTSPERTRRHGFHGSDQAWMSLCLGPNEKMWTPEDDGVYAFRSDLKKIRYQLPKDARIVFFQGHNDPWDEYSLRVAPWIREHYK